MSTSQQKNLKLKIKSTANRSKRNMQSQVLGEKEMVKTDQEQRESTVDYRFQKRIGINIALVSENSAKRSHRVHSQLQLQPRQNCRKHVLSSGTAAHDTSLA
jgi:hypothetical protein